MRRFIATSALSLLLEIPLMAQLVLGVRGGVNFVDNDITAVNMETVTQTDKYTGFFFGPMLEIDFWSLGIDIAALYSQKGFELARHESLKQQMIDIPANLKFYFNTEGDVSPFFHAGGQFSYKTGELLNLYDDTMEGDAGLYQIQSFAIDRSNWSINIGAGLRFFRHVQITVNYNMPVTHEGAYLFYDELKKTEVSELMRDHEKLDEWTAKGESKFKSSTLQVSLSCTF